MGACCSAPYGADVDDADAERLGKSRKRSCASECTHVGEHGSRRCSGSGTGRAQRKECIILLLGSGESGKSTIVKQMKIIHQNGYSRQELLAYRACIYRNVIECAHCLIMAMADRAIPFADAAVDEAARRLLQLRYDAGSQDVVGEDVALDVMRVVSDRAALALRELRQPFYLPDSAPYFFEHCVRIGQADYVPTEQDVLRARTKTTGILEARFSMGQLDIHMIDVGGQRSERRKWINTFDRVTSVIFCVALSEYNQTLLEQDKQNRMAESLVVFESIINSRWFVRTSIILFLNKMDLFREKLAKYPLEDYFPEYCGGNDVNKAAKFILWRFTMANHAHLSIYPHLTQATDTSNIRLVFAAVKLTILQNALKDSGIL